MRHLLFAAVAAIVLPISAQAEEVPQVASATPVAAMDVEAPQTEASPVMEQDWSAKGPPRALLDRPWLTSDMQRAWFTPLPARPIAVSSAQ